MIFNDFRSFNRIEHHRDLAPPRLGLVLGEAGAALLLPVPQHVVLVPLRAGMVR
jgi:hypothetical protein